MVESALFLCSFAVLAGFVRIFGDLGYLGRSTVAIASTSVLAALLRRRGVGPLISTFVHLAAGVVVLANLYLSEQLTYRLPTIRTFTTAYQMVFDDVEQLRTAVPPVTASTGLVLAVTALLWALAFFADTAAMRVHATVQAVAPLVIMFVAVGVSQPGFHRVPVTIAFAVAVGLYAFAVRRTRHSSLPWVGDPSKTRTGPVRLGISGLLMSLVVLIALGAAATIPQNSEPVWSLRQRQGTKGREVVSPFVSIRSLLGARSDRPMFRVSSDTPSYWRLTALDTYDPARDIWISSGRYTRIGRHLSGTTDPRIPTETVDQHFEVLGIGGPWVPAMFEPEQYSGGPDATFNSATSTLFADEDLTDGQRYEITSESPVLDPKDLASLGRPSFDDIDEDLLRVPVESAPERIFLDGVVEGLDDPYAQLIALQNEMRTGFTYSEEVDYSDRTDPVAAFLTDRAGFCQQFSSTFAVMARRLGMPSRVAVGFTMGEPVQEDSGKDGEVATHDDPSATTFLVRGGHAHAWPEVFFPTVGWVAFEPTPGRGNPATTAYTGVAAGQADLEPSADQTATTAATETTTAAANTPPTTVPVVATTSAPDVGAKGDERDSGSTEDTGRRDTRLIALGIVILVMGIIAMTIVAVRRRRGPYDGTDSIAAGLDPDSRTMLHSWDEALRSLERIDLHIEEADTPIGFAERVGVEIGPIAGTGDDELVAAVRTITTELSRLASIETVRRYSPLFSGSDQTDREAVEHLITESRECSSLVVRGVEVLTNPSRRREPSVS